MTALYNIFAVTGPALTTFGAGLLAYDVMRGPMRLIRRQQHAGRLEAAATTRDESMHRFEMPESGYSTQEQAVVAKIDARFDSVVDRLKGRFESAVTQEYDRAFYLGVAGLVLVGVGGICETAAALLAWAGHVR